MSETITTYYDAEAGAWVGRAGRFVSQGLTPEEAEVAVVDAAALVLSAEALCATIAEPQP